eukprot:4910262-Lingulodinium_polyedra.AAC.1
MGRSPRPRGPTLRRSSASGPSRCRSGARPTGLVPSPREAPGRALGSRRRKRRQRPTTSRF